MIVKILFIYLQTQVVARNDSTAGRVLVIKSIRREDAGEYVCMASNREGAARSRALFLAIQCKYHEIY